MSSCSNLGCVCRREPCGNICRVTVWAVPVTVVHRNAGPRSSATTHKVSSSVAFGQPSPAVCRPGQDGSVDSCCGGGIVSPRARDMGVRRRTPCSCPCCTRQGRSPQPDLRTPRKCSAWTSGVRLPWSHLAPRIPAPLPSRPGGHIRRVSCCGYPVLAERGQPSFVSRRAPEHR